MLRRMHAAAIAKRNEIIRIVNGSRLYGTAVETSDHDEMAVFIEPPEVVFGGGLDHYKERTQPEGARSFAGDVDSTSYSLRRFVQLASQGNPSVLCLLFAKGDAILKETSASFILQSMYTPYIVSKAAAPRFLGYMQSQRLRLTGEKRGHVPSRPELVEKYGYDTKYAMHLLRLAMQGTEFLNTGRMTLPMPVDQRELLLAVRGGEYSLEAVLKSVDLWENELKKAAEHSPLPDAPSPRLPALLAELHFQYWNMDRWSAGNMKFFSSERETTE